ncbi:hypothetical protein HPB48_005492 [Haemaphysalis longicornis]|uniref:J domain-containing protein n=1 Tax=Haemaphysalis longicornis TaxID=44386 RepID=A0A9J6H1M0_HAELO|nr:hypothetical protein HPB48_005492 [Haemaphysalis longicornis]
MAAPAAETSSEPKRVDDSVLQSFFSEVKEIEKRDSVLTPKQQIDRLLRPGSTYFNLNPFEVLQISPEAPIEDVKKQYRRLSILVHPDKNPEDRERAQKAFDVINKAHKSLEDEEQRQRALEVIEEAKGRTDLMIEEKRKKQRKAGKGDKVDEDDPEKVSPSSARGSPAGNVLSCDISSPILVLGKRKREAEIREQEKAQQEKEWHKNYEESRENRVSSWKNFQTGKKSKTFKPPKHRAETR